MALHKGDIDNFNFIIDTYKNQYFSQPSLAAKHEDIKKKVVLLCLLNIAFERPSHDRTISFVDIASKTRIPLDQVERREKTYTLARLAYISCIYITSRNMFMIHFCGFFICEGIFLLTDFNHLGY